MSYVIEDGIPPPPQAHQGRPKGLRNEILQLVAQMKPGQSVLLTEHKDYEAVRGGWLRLVGAFRSKKLREGWRVWRIS